MTSPQRDRGYQFLATATWFTGMGWSIAISVLLGVLLGNWLDGRTGTHPVFLLIFLIAGLAGGLTVAGKMLMRYLAQPS